MSIERQPQPRQANFHRVDCLSEGIRASSLPAGRQAQQENQLGGTLLELTAMPESAHAKPESKYSQDERIHIEFALREGAERTAVPDRPCTHKLHDRHETDRDA